MAAASSTSILNICGRVAGAGLAVTLLAVAGVIAPVVSAVALPIFGIMSIPNWVKHRSLYNATLVNGGREKYGRVPGQDYTRWTGVPSTIKPTEKDLRHERINSYVNGRPLYDSPNLTTTFNAQEDFEWLEKEYARRIIEDKHNRDLKVLRAFAKALVPLIGFFWVLKTETRAGGASDLSCSVCMAGGNKDNKHWGWEQAIRHHMGVFRSAQEELKSHQKGDEISDLFVDMISNLKGEAG